MSFVETIKAAVKSNPLGLYLVERRKHRLYERYAQEYSDREFIEMLYKKANHGLSPDLENPKKFTEKLQWLKLYYRDPAIPICSDKVEAKRYVAEHGYPELVIPNIAVYDSADEVDEKALPDRFILKASHGSGWNILCRDKSKIDWLRMKKVMATWLKENLYIYGREWNYKEQTPRLLAEELLDDHGVVDYKFMCFNGVCRAMQVNHDEDGVHYVDLYDENWQLLPDMGTGTAPHSDRALPKPEQFEEMKAIAEDLAKPFPFVRVDLYHVNGKIYFGEMTFFPGSGFWSITPPSRDRQFGDWLTLPEKNNG